MENPKAPSLQQTQDLRDEQQTLEWLDDLGIGFLPASPKRVHPFTVKKERNSDAA